MSTGWWIVPFVVCSFISAQTTAPVTPSHAQAVPLPVQAWKLLRSGAHEKGTEHRAAAIRSLSLLRGEKRAGALAIGALGDPKPEVRTAAATALGELRDHSAIPALKDALSDKELTVVLAAAHSLLALKDTSPYDTYYAILTGDRKGSGVISSQMEILKDPKKMALLGFREGIGYVPFGDIGYTAIRTVTRDSSAPVRAAAAKVLASDPDPVTQNMLAQEALTDRSELVRIAALEAVSRHGDPVAIAKIGSALSDPKYSVRYAAAATILHLNDISRRKRKRESRAPMTND
ncbi:MAG: HEAT repeat domain-containing protein [Terriglobales bacterium]